MPRHSAYPFDTVSLQRPRATLLLAAPRGFCAGVTRAIQAVRDAIAVHGAPVYVRRAIVHNLAVVRELEQEGAVFVEEASEAPPGAVLIFSAHGVAPQIAMEARSMGLTAYDAVCPLVAKVHREVERHHRAGRLVLIIGHRGHPEIEGTMAHLPPGGAVVVASVTEARALEIEKNTPVALAVQTTFAVEDAAEIAAVLRARFADLAEPPSSDICYATSNRQAAIRAIARRSAAVVVAGAAFSSNARRLAEVAGNDCRSVQLVAEPAEIDWAMLPEEGAIGLTAAASTPESIVQAIIAALGERYALDIEEVEVAREEILFKPLAIGPRSADGLTA